ncbi:MAG: TonB-dependent receptor [Gammaproteobacteria bacterium]|nr:TonB-dependent receptor [Gammaproteobacteria bacterium]
MRNLNRSALRTSVAALAVGSSFGAFAQADSGSIPEEIIITGTSLKGVAPVGATIMTVGRDELESIGAQTVQQVLKTVPAVVGNNTAGQGGFGSFDGSATNAPTIHSLGASASNSTLILLNGHRLPVGGVNHVLGDPNIVAPLALERVEVLADGASSVYGSDAVAGVINFITRRNVDGVEFTAQKGFGDGYDTFTAGVLFGKAWDNGSALISYNYSDRSNLRASDRDYTNWDHTALGGTNQANSNQCRTPAFTDTATGLTYFSPYSGAGLSSAAARDFAASTADCDSRDTYDIVPSELRHNVLVSAQQDLSDRLRLTGDVIYSNRETSRNVQRGSGSNITIYGSGAPAGFSNNPFFVAPAGTGATSGRLNFLADGVLGSGAHQDGTAETLYFRGDAEYQLSDAWSFNIGAIHGRDRSRVENIDYLCGSCLNLAMNGRTSANVNGVPTTVTMVLTPDNAIDPFGNGTSAATKAFLTDSREFTQAIQRMTNVYAKVDGDVFELPAGVVKIAVGGEYIDYGISQDKVSPTQLGPHSANSAFLHLDYARDVKSAYAELFVPLVSPDMNVPGVYKLEMNIAGRVDDYSDFGSTTNPKIALNWEVMDGLRFRGNWGKSFVAPALTSTGANEFGQTAESTFGGAGGAAFDVPYSTYPLAAQIPNCNPTASSCAFNAGGVNNVAGVQVNGGFAGLTAQTGESWSIGADFTPEFAPGLRISVTYWDNNLRGGVTAPSTGLVLSAPDLASRLQVYPNGATPAEIAAAVGTLPQNSPLPTTPIYFIFDFRQGNVVNLDVAGIDFDMNYTFDTERAGSFTIGGAFTRKLKFDGFNGAGGEVFDALGTAGVFTTFQSIKLEARGHLGWDYRNFNSHLYVNYTDGYENRGLFGTDNTGYPVERNSLGIPISGGRPVSSFTTVDLNVAYTFEDLFGFGEAKVYVDVSNLLDEDPPFVNANFAGYSGYDSFNASPIGRVVSVGLRTKF